MAPARPPERWVWGAQPPGTTKKEGMRVPTGRGRGREVYELERTIPGKNKKTSTIMKRLQYGVVNGSSTASFKTNIYATQKMYPLVPWGHQAARLDFRISMCQFSNAAIVMSNVAMA